MTTKRVDVGDLTLGMYIAELDRPWLESPFLFQGFPLREKSDLEWLQEHCHYVYIDVEDTDRWTPRIQKGVGAAVEKGEHEAPAPGFDPPVIEHRQELDRNKVRFDADPRFHTQRINVESPAVPTPATVSFETELKSAVAVYTSARRYIGEVLRDVRLGRSIDTEGARTMVDRMAGSIMRNENALVWFTRLRKRDHYTSMHSINVCILSLLFGRHLGLALDELRELGLGALLHDIGKMKVPLTIINKALPLDSEELAQLQQHPAHGYRLLKETGDIPPKALDVVYGHHERIDGSGYPRALKGPHISRYAIIVSIVDVYDAITSDRVYHMGVSPHEALNIMYGWAPKSFPADMLEAFIRCLGIYPVGSIVELDTGEIGVVLATNRRRHLLPLVALVLDRDKKPYIVQKLFDLEAQERAGAPLNIKRILGSKAYGIDVGRVMYHGRESAVGEIMRPMSYQ